MRPCLALLMLCSLLAAGCEQLGIESAAALAARKLADGKAVGGACRHAGRAIEDCYALNKKTDKAAVFAGWREMNEYMQENKLEVVAPLIRPEPAVVAAAPAASAIDPDHEADGDAAEPAPRARGAAKPAH